MKIKLFTKAVFFYLLAMTSCDPSSHVQKSAGDDWQSSVLNHYSPQLDSFLARKDELGIQIIYTSIDRTSSGKPKFTDHFFNLDDHTYFYPASTVKLPVAILALQRLNELNLPGVNKNTTMITGAASAEQTAVTNDPSASDGRPTIAHYIRKILLVSDNDAFNRLYEFLGQEYINGKLHAMGYNDISIVHRLDISLTEEQNRLSNPVQFLDDSGHVVYEQQPTRSKWVYEKRDTKLGKGFMRGGQLIQQPFDFSIKNKMSLSSLHSIVRSIMFPENVEKEKRFNLTQDDYSFLRKYMSMLPAESKNPEYDPKEYWSHYVKTIYYGNSKEEGEKHIRIFNKTGTAYGFLIDASYFADYKNNIEFMVSAVIYCNSDGIFNDDHYDYEQVGYPFFKDLGRAIYAHELKRHRLHKPNLDAFTFDYTK